MNKKYLTYSLEELLDDDDFIAYLVYGIYKDEWELLFQSSPELKRKALHANKIIEALRDSHEELSEREILALWQDIDKYDNVMLKKQKGKIFYVILRYAAVSLFLVSVSAVSWFYFGKDKTDEAYEFSESVIPLTGGDARLILHSGEEIALQKENSLVEVNPSGEIVINQQQIISSKKAKSEKVAAMNEVAIPYGKKSQLILADGTKVWLNAGSRIAFPSEFNEFQRTVFLEGEAYFEVTHIDNQPFVVNVKEIAIKVLGTCFNITAYTADPTIETILLEGKVSLLGKTPDTSRKNETILEVNQLAVYSKSNKSFDVEEIENSELYTAWIKGLFLFSQRNLHDVLLKLERYYNVEFVIDNQLSTRDMISGKLDLKDSLEYVLKALSDVAGFQFTIIDREVHIKVSNKK